MKLDPGVVTGKQQLLPSMLENLDPTATITGVREAGATYQYSDFCLDVTIGKSEFELPVKAINEDFRALAKKHGLDTDKWAGKKIKLSTEDYTSTRTKRQSEIIRFEVL